MNRTFKERVAARFARLVRKHKWTLPFCYVAMAVVFACYDTGCHFGNNCKRYISILALAVIFVSTSSFASPTLLSYGEENSLAQNMDAMPDPGIQTLPLQRIMKIIPVKIRNRMEKSRRMKTNRMAMITKRWNV